MEADGTLDWGSSKQYGTLTWDTNKAIVVAQGGSSLEFRTNNTGVALQIDTSQNSTFLGEVSTTNAKLKAIAESNTDTAVDVFVYDTRKDSDGGAWRKRTQNTSWYNEALNTSTRGARKEFPCVAVIVLESTKLTIYDGDDPDMPMWMKFVTQDSGAFASITAINGSIYCGQAASTAAYSGNGYFQLNFAADYFFSNIISIFSTHRQGRADGLLTSYNYKPRGDRTTPKYVLVAYQVADIAMTVLPNAPIDADTGLPVPTIAVATDGGVSVIKDNGTVVDIVSSYLNHETPMQVKFVGDRVFWLGQNNYDNGWSSAFTVKIPNADLSVNYNSGVGSLTKYSSKEWSVHLTNGSDITIPIAMNSPRTSVLLEAGTNDELILGGKGADDHGTVVKVVENLSNPESGMIAQIASDYNTGYQVGDIKLASLSDTDTTNAVGTELVTNGTFASNTTGWAGVSGTIAIASSQLRLTGGGSSTVVAYAQQTFATTVGKAYTVSVDFISISGGTNRYIYIGTSTSGANRFNIVQLSNAQVVVGTNTFTFVAQSTTSLISLGTYEAQVAVWDNVTVRLAEEDRSWNGNGVQVFGTVTKTAVATGAELVGYSGWGTSNYMLHSVSTNYGSPAVVSFMGWQKVSSIAGYQYMASVIDGTSGNMFGMSVNQTGVTNAGKPYFYDSVNSSLVATTRVDDGTWHFMVGVFDGTSKKLYIDGKLNASATVTALAMTNVTATNVGFYSPTITGTKQYFHLGSIALIRTSATAPTAEQIAKMYNDEKHLFRNECKSDSLRNIECSHSTRIR